MAIPILSDVNLTGTLAAVSLDISGSVDIDGTMEADAITVNGTTLAEYISDTVGAMFTGNTETNITATYQDGDNTIDLVVASGTTYTAGDGITLNTAEFDLDAALTTVTSIYNTSLLIGRASGTEYISFAVDNKVVIHVDSTEYRFLGSALVPGTDNARDLGSSVKRFQDGYFGGSVKCEKNFRRTVTTAANSSNTHTCTLIDNDNFNIAVANAATTIALVVASENVGQSGMIVLTNPASVGSLSFVALPSYMLTPSGATLNFVTTANAVSIISYYVHATDKVLVNYVGNFA